MKHADTTRWDKPSRAWAPKHARSPLAAALHDIVTGFQNSMHQFARAVGAAK